MAKRSYKKRRKNNNGFLYLISFFGILLIIFLFTSGILTFNIDGSQIVNGHSNNKTGDNIDDNMQNTGTNYYRNSTVNDVGILKKIDYSVNGGYSHEIKTNFDSFFAKSQDIILDDYVDKKIEFNGEVIGYSSDDVPVLNINSIQEKLDKNIENEEENKEKEEDKKQVNKNKVIYLKGIEVNLVGTNYLLNESNGDIIVYKNVGTGNAMTGNILPSDNFEENSNFNEVLRISPYKCLKGSNLYDCKNLKQQAIDYKFKSMTNNFGNVFYKYSEINKYFVLNDTYGYNIVPSGTDMAKFVNFIKLTDLQSKINKTIKNTCKNDEIVLNKILTIQNSDSNYEVVGFDKNSNKINCKLSIDGEKQMVGQLKSISFKKDEEKIVSEELNEEDYIVYESKGFPYSVYMPKTVKYSSKLVSKDFGISGLDCKQVVDIANWSDGNLEDPNVRVYYCVSELSKDSIVGLLNFENYLYNFKKDENNNFIIAYKSDDTSKKIVKKLKIY